MRKILCLLPALMLAPCARPDGGDPARDLSPPHASRPEAAAYADVSGVVWKFTVTDPARGGAPVVGAFCYVAASWYDASGKFLEAHNCRGQTDRTGYVGVADLAPPAGAASVQYKWSVVVVPYNPASGTGETAVNTTVPIDVSLGK